MFYLSRGLIFGLYAAMSPGPFQAFLLAQTIKNGGRKTIITAFAPLLSDIPVVTLVLFILAQTPDKLLQILQVLGGCFILYLAKGAFTAARGTMELTAPVTDSTQQSLVKGLLMNFLNPNPYIFWSLIGGPLFLQGWGENAYSGISFLVGFYIMLVGGFMGLVVLFATTKQLGAKVTTILNGVSGVILVWFGLYQIWRGLTALWD